MKNTILLQLISHFTSYKHTIQLVKAKTVSECTFVHSSACLTVFFYARPSRISQRNKTLHFTKRTTSTAFAYFTTLTLAAIIHGQLCYSFCDVTLPLHKTYDDKQRNRITESILAWVESYYIYLFLNVAG